MERAGKLDINAPAFIPTQTNDNRREVGSSQQRSHHIAVPPAHSRDRRREKRGQIRGTDTEPGSARQGLTGQISTKQAGGRQRVVSIGGDSDDLSPAAALPPGAAKGSSKGRRNSGRLGKLAVEHANHLLNFQYEPRQQGESYGRGSQGRANNQKATGLRRLGSSGTQMRKGQFVQANFQFVMLPLADRLHESFFDPDALVDWGAVETVRVRDNPVGPDAEGLRCPICLEEPRCPRITKCGHVFCAVCILRHLGAEASRRCPMCFEFVERPHLKAAALHQVSAFRCAEATEFVLLGRSRDKLVPDPPGAKRPAPVGASGGSLGGAVEAPGAFCPKEGTAHERFSRLVLARPRLLRERLEQELRELAAFRVECIGGGDTEWVPYISEASAALESDYARLGKEGQFADDGSWEQEEVGELEQWERPPPPTEAFSDGETKAPDAPPTPTHALKAGGADDPPDSWEFEFGQFDSGSDGGKATPTPERVAISGDAWGSDCEDDGGDWHEHDKHDYIVPGMGPSSQASHPPELQPKMRSAAETPTSYFSFYQAADGQRAFLHPLSMKCLMEGAGQDTSKLPARVTAKVLETESMRLTREMRRRLAFLGHLPEHSDVCFVELDLRHMLSDETLAKFKPEMQKRQRKRKNKVREEVREKALEAKALAEKIERLQMLRNMTIDLHGPLPGAELDVPLVLTEDPEAPTSPSDAGPAPAGPAEAALAADDEPGWSFARITAMGGHFPSLKPKTDYPSLSESAAVAAPKSGTTPPAASGVWGRSPSVGGASAAALGGSMSELKIGSPATGSMMSGPVSAGKSTGKKSKGKGVALFSNAGARNLKR